MRDAERLLADVQRLTDAGYWEWDVPEDRITWSPELYRLFGVEPEGFDATYQAYTELLHPDDRATVEDVVQRAYATGQDYSVEHRVVQPDGTIRWVLSRGTVETREGEVERLFGVAVDVTMRKRSEEVLRDFISNAAHELRTPVAALTGAVDLLTDPRGGDGDRARLLDVVARQVGRLRELSEDLLDLTTLEARSATVLLAPVAVAAVVERAAARAGVHDVVVDIADDAQPLAGAEELEQALARLLDNARRHAGDGAAITVRARREGAQVVLEVEDDGPGVPPHHRASIFAPFSRGGATRAPGAGSGLGLSVTQRLVSLLGGSIVYRDRPGGGARFEIRLGAQR